MKGRKTHATGITFVGAPTAEVVGFLWWSRATSILSLQESRLRRAARAAVVGVGVRTVRSGAITKAHRANPWALGNSLAKGVSAVCLERPSDRLCAEPAA